MTRWIKKRWSRVGALFGVASGLMLVVGFGVLAGAGTAARSAIPQNTSPPTITGTPQEGIALTGSTGSWTDSPTGFSYAWSRCDQTGGSCANISAATNASYTLTTADVGNTVRVQVQAMNAEGSASATSVPTAVIAAATSGGEPQNTSLPTVAGTAQVGQALTGSKGTWANTPTDYNYFWSRCDSTGGSCANISGANNATYTVTSADVSNTLRFKVQATNASGSTFASSVPTAVVATAVSSVPQATSLPVVTGTAQVGKRLAGDRGRWTNSPTDYNYVWTRCATDGGSCVNISGANAVSYVLTTADVGHRLRFKVQATNNAGATVASSAATAVVVPATVSPPPPPTTGCPSGTGPVLVTGVSSPARLLIDLQQSSPTVVTRGTSQLIVRYHVSACGGRSVQGAFVYATATPFSQLSVPPEAPTNSSGWAELDFRMLSGFPVSSKQQLIAIFARARKPGENLLGGISTRRLFSIQVRQR